MTSANVQIEIRPPRETAAYLERIAKKAGVSMNTMVKVTLATELLRVEAPKASTPAELTDEQIDLICSPGRAKRWNNDGRQYDRDTARLIERHLRPND